MKRFKAESLLILFQLMELVLLGVSIYESGSDNYFSLILFGIIICLFFMVHLFLKGSGESYLFILACFLLSIGTMMVYRLNPNFGIKQAYLILIAIIAFLIVFFTAKNYPNPQYLFYVLIFISIALFIITLIFGTVKYGSKNWIDLKFFQFQPAELIKIITAFFIAIYYSEPEAVLIQEKGNSSFGFKIYENKNEVFLPVSKNFPVEKYNSLWRNYGGFIIAFIVYIEIGFLFLQKDLGTAVLFFLLILGVQFIYERDRRCIFMHLIIAVLGIALAVTKFNHVKVRIDAWLRPMDFADGKGYQIIQSQIAIAEGGLFGTGIGLGSPGFIPVVTTDFIFSAICEEMGIFTGIAIIMIFMLMVYRGFKIGMSKPKNFWGVLSIALSILLGAQAFIILAGVTRFIPMTGVTLPFVSYGGSSLIVSYALIALLEVANEK